MAVAPVTLASIWSQLSTDERLSILLERQTADLVRLAAEADSMDALARARAAGYSSAIADIMYFVVEGHPLAPLDH